jgi:stress response protein YsnF
MAKHSSDAESLRSTTGEAAEPVDAIDTVLSAERLQVGRERVPTRIARLQKFIVTEQRTITVEVRHEEARLVYEDLPAGEDAAGRSS